MEGPDEGTTIDRCTDEMSKQASIDTIGFYGNRLLDGWRDTRSLGWHFLFLLLVMF